LAIVVGPVILMTLHCLMKMAMVIWVTMATSGSAKGADPF